MSLYNFKRIAVVPSGNDFIDIILSKTQRKTPTVVHKGYSISRIRSFYMRKVKYTQQNYHDKLSAILTDFPIIDNIHPFYADLINVLYDKDHYKLALGQLNTARHLIDNIGKDYARLLKYGDSLYRCKQLKRAALGRMCTIMKKQTSTLAYLEQVRQHLARLPSIDPTTRTLLLCGYPNVGKSSFINKMTRADVEVQPYAFTTKSLFVGHMDYKYTRWQIIDTPGILDHPLEERNTIEMQAITAIAHLRAAVLYVFDLSEQCGHTLAQQVALCRSLRPLLAGKPLVLALNKTDVKPLDAIASDDRALIDALAEELNAPALPMSTLTDEGLSDVKQAACDRLLEARVEAKLKSTRGPDLLARLQVAVPQPRDSKSRGRTIPPSVQKAREEKAAREEAMRTAEEEEARQKDDYINWIDEYAKWDGQGDVPGFNSKVWKEKYQLKNDEWKFDIIPEIMDGRNIADFMDPDILARLDELEAEEEELAALAEARGELLEDEEDEESLNEEEKEQLSMIREKKTLLKTRGQERRGTGGQTAAVKPRKTRSLSLSGFADHLSSMGLDPTAAVDGARSRSKSRGRKRLRDEMADDDEEGGEEGPETKKLKGRRSRSRSLSKTPAPKAGEGFRDVDQKIQAIAMERKYQAKNFAQHGKAGESDRRIPVKMPKHLFAGKRGAGKTDYR